MGWWQKTRGGNRRLTHFIANLVQITLTKDMFIRVRKTKKSDCWLHLVCISVCPSVGRHVTVRLQIEGFPWSTTRRKRFSCWITKATNIQSEHAILIAFPRQQWLRERTWIRLYMHIGCLVTYKDRDGYWFNVCRFYMNCTALRHTCHSNAFIWIVLP